MPRRIMREFRIEEISAVDSPAQKGARAAILKRDAGTRTTLVTKGDDAGKVLVEAEDGHQHILDVTRRVGETSYAASGAGETYDYHTHPYVVGEDGRVTVGMAGGHSHELEQSVVDEALRRAAMAAADDRREGEVIHYRDPGAGPRTKRGAYTMPESITKADLDKAVEDAVNPVKADLEKARSENERLAKIAGLTGAQKAHFDALEGDAADAFLALDEGARDAAVEKAARDADEEDPVVYKSDGGTEYRKSDDPRLVAMARERDEDRRELKAAKAATENARIEKRAGEIFKHAKGKPAVHVAIVKAVEGIEDEALRGEAVETLKSMDRSTRLGFETLGEDGEEAVGDLGHTTKSDAEAQLDKLAKAHAEKHGVDYATAYGKVLETSEGHELYKRTIS